LPVLAGCRTIQLTQGFNALVNDDDYRLLGGLAAGWHLGNVTSRYAKTRLPGSGRGRFTYLHRVVFSLRGETIPRGRVVDFKNLDTLDCRRENLRVASRSEDRANLPKLRFRGGTTSRFKGVCWDNGNQRYVARCHRDGRQCHLGSFHCELDAALAYNTAAAAEFGEFARLNDLAG